MELLSEKGVVIQDGNEHRNTKQALLRDWERSHLYFGEDEGKSTNDEHVLLPDSPPQQNRAGSRVCHGQTVSCHVESRSATCQTLPFGFDIGQSPRTRERLL